MSEEDGFTVVELLAAMAVGAVVLAAVFGLLETAFPVQARTAERVDTTVRARTAMGELTQRLRSQACLTATEAPIVEGSDARRLRFYGSLAPERTASGLDLQARQVRYDAGRRALLEDVWRGLDPATTTTFPSAPATETRVLATDVEPPADRPMFAFHAYEGDPGRIGADALPVPLSRESAQRTVLVELALTATGAQLEDERVATTLTNAVFLRTADPLNPVAGPSCG